MIDVAEHSGLVWREVHRCRRPLGAALGRDDLFQAGWFGLRRAAEKFDASRGFAFSTYATRWIRHEIYREIENRRHTIRVPVWRQEQARRLKEGSRFDSSSADAPTFGDGPSLLDRAVSDEPGPDEVAATGEARELLIAALGRLDERSRGIIVSRFWDEQKLEEIGDRLGLTKERIRQIEVEALHALRKHITHGHPAF